MISLLLSHPGTQVYQRSGVFSLWLEGQEGEANMEEVHMGGVYGIGLEAVHVAHVPLVRDHSSLWGRLGNASGGQLLSGTNIVL